MQKCSAQFPWVSVADASAPCSSSARTPAAGWSVAAWTTRRGAPAKILRKMRFEPSVKAPPLGFNLNAAATHISGPSYVRRETRCHGNDAR